MTDALQKEKDDAVRAGRIAKPAMVLGRYWLFNPEDFK